ncbi:MAG: SMI1/KNR4 family protein [Pirellulales bacterium]
MSLNTTMTASILLTKQGPCISDADVRCLESRIGRELPADYRAFLLTCNGGRPSYHVIRDPDLGDLGVQLFFGIREDEFYSIDAEHRNMRGRRPERCLCFAIDGCGNAFCLSLGSPDYGSVYFWDHEEEAPEGDGPTEDNVYHLADSFTGFWNRMEPIDPDVYFAEITARGNSEDPAPEPNSPRRSEINGEPH